jgi:hypothetical protein
LKPFIDAGGWVFSAVIMFAVLSLVYTGKLVPRFVYDREIQRADKATAIAEKSVDGLTSVAAQTESLSKLLEGFISGGRVRRS